MRGRFSCVTNTRHLCRSDLNTFTGKRTEKTPTILGHEIVGVIDALGPMAPARDCRGIELRVGDRVTWAIYAADPQSSMSRLGLPQKAPDLFKYGHEKVTADQTLHGGLAEYCVLRRHTPVVRLDRAIPLPVAALINCSVATVAGSLRLAGSVQHRTVIIAGAGMLGIIACAMCRCGGAQRLIAVDIDEQRLATARTLGVDLTINLKPGAPALKEQLAIAAPGMSPIVALDYSGAPDTMEALIDTLGVGGTAVFIGATFPQRPLQISAERLIRNVHTLRGLHNYNEQDLIAAVEFIEQHHRQFPFESLVHDGFPLAAVAEAFEYAVSAGAHRVGVRLACCQPSGR